MPTIEDFHKKVFKIRGDVYRLDILDTSGNDPFPAMKKLNIMTGKIKKNKSSLYLVFLLLINDIINNHFKRRRRKKRLAKFKF